MSAINRQLKNIFLIFSFLFSFSGCSNSKTELEKLAWLTGRWENTNEEMKTVEIWERKTSGEFQVRGFMVEGADTLFAENIKVASKQGNVFYTVTISEQNNGKPIHFKLTANTGKKAIFENPKHDFPQKIFYESKSPDSVLVQISGLIKNKPQKQAYYLVRNKN